VYIVDLLSTKQKELFPVTHCTAALITDKETKNFFLSALILVD